MAVLLSFQEHSIWPEAGALKQYLAKVANRVFQYDLDAYLVFRDVLAKHELRDVENLPQSQKFQFRLLDGNSDLEGLKELCLAGGYFGESSHAVGTALVSRFSNDERCATAFDGDKCVAMSWIASGDAARWPAFARFPRLGEACGLLHMSYVRPEYRGNQLQRCLDLIRKQQLKTHGEKYSVCFVGVKNFASIRSLMATNEEYRLVYHLTLDAALLPRLNFFLKTDVEQWQSCRQQVERWVPQKRARNDG
jgi:hypothetical protein